MGAVPRPFAVLLLALTVALAVPGTAGALLPRQIFGIGNVGDAAVAFSDPALKALRPRATRQTANWNVARTPGYERDRVDAWYSASLAAGLEPLLSFQGFKQRRAPTVAAYQGAVRAALRRWPLITEWQAWNEANHETQPATYRHPERAARYALALERACPWCTVLPVTVQISDSTSTRAWIQRFLRVYGRTPRIWALHGYSDANRRTFVRLRRFLRDFPRGRVWITETGALAKFATRVPYDLARQRRMTRYVFGAATRFHGRVDRLYWWQWRGAMRPRRVRWDSGLLDAHGRPRPAYRAALAERFSRR
jgi:hypothetical protein